MSTALSWAPKLRLRPNAVIDDKFVLRACVVNFRTTLADIEALPQIVARNGRQVDSEMRPAALQDG